MIHILNKWICVSAAGLLLFTVSCTTTKPEASKSGWDGSGPALIVSTPKSGPALIVRTPKSEQDMVRMEAEKHQAEIERLTRQLTALEGKTEQEQEAKIKLESEKRTMENRLAAVQRFNELHSEVLNYYTPDEAEVYKQGHQLIIRLKDFKFPFGKAIIMPRNYNLLGKVQQSIKAFGEPDVVIEGHTDSTGSSAFNEQLSQKRALVVTEYFLQKRTLSKENFMALGYGADRPLASNATAEGRATNRRIDVVIKPQMEKVLAAAGVSGIEISPTISKDRLIGSAVQNMDGRRVGKISDVSHDNEGNIRFVILSQGSMPGIEEKLIPIPLNAVSFSAEKLAFVDISEEKLKTAPSISKGESPAVTNRIWVNKTSRFYGVRPYWDESGMKKTEE